MMEDWYILLFTELRKYLIKQHIWLSFKLIIIGVIPLYIGVFINNADLELFGLLLVGVGFYKIPIINLELRKWWNS